ncbi:peroxiredoxin [Antarcticimicrobium luteum]|uniref:Glutathione-dependent peroxiredoxin n=1 Tax=Antarcticimicrobium luteum TaxID=2547397 RepID=A0A4R5UXC9_9RHOB|nr:peroxiredoxin [Antarcticimicrobium luteum]TDK43949.1 peroxiredoxin [Antarcticimicrobium luteum]
MSIKPGDRLPEATLTRLSANGPDPVKLSDLTTGRKVVIFGLPGPFTGTCSTSHLPSFMRTAQAFKDKGVDEIICIAVNDAWVMDAWDKATGAGAAGVTLLADHASELTKALGQELTVPAIGFFSRSKRFALVAEDGVITHLQEEVAPGACDLTTGETLLSAL